jgi:hypothetical protein
LAISINFRAGYFRVGVLSSVAVPCPNLVERKCNTPRESRP